LGKLDVASKYYEKSLSLNPVDSKTAYSYSLLLIDMKRLDDALKYAKIAYTKPDTPKSLKQKLIKLGAWRD
jgi:tetratricopeptide (TPR) repeat protein